MSNLKFWIQYQNKNPWPIETHFIGEQERKRPLEDVASLIYAYQFRPGSILANTDSAMLSLRSVKNGDLSDPLRPGLLLKDLTDGLTDDKPLVIGN